MFDIYFLFFIFVSVIHLGVSMVSNNSNNKQKVSNLERGLQLVREGNLHQADICFDAEMTQSYSPNFNVFVHHGHLLNRLGQYNGAIAKFDSFLNNHPKDVSCLFGKGISNIGLLNLDDALSFFEKVIDICPRHADAYFYAAIIYCNPFYRNYDSDRAKELYEKYQIKREDFFNNNPDYFNQLGDDLSIDKLGEYYDGMHNFYNLSDLFIFINQLLESGSVDQFNNFLEDYKKLNFINEYSEEQFNIFRLFDDDTLLFDKIESFNSNKSVEDEFKYVGYDKALIDDLSSKFHGLTIGDEETLIKIMDFFKNSDLSFKDFHDLIRENILEGNLSIDSFYKKREHILKSRINENNRKLRRNIEKQLNMEWDKKIKEKRQLENSNVELDKMIAENKRLKADVADLNGMILENEKFKITMSTLIESFIDKSNRKNKLLYILIIFIIIFFDLLLLLLYFYYTI